MNRLQLSRILMIATIILIAGFQGYWLTRLYKDEKQGLKKEADVLFRESVYKLQMHKFKGDTLLSKIMPDNLFFVDAVNVLKQRMGEAGDKSKMVISMSTSASFSRDSAKIAGDSTKIFISSTNERRPMLPGRPPSEFSRVIFKSSLGDSLSAKQIDSAYSRELVKAKINVPFQITSQNLKTNRVRIDSVEDDALNTHYITLGLPNPIAYRAELGNAFNYLLGKITYPILISLLLITLTTASFVFLYRNLLAQQRLTSIKNDFISNITHELKTPIATVNVAIEALKNFNAIDNPERTKEYLDISSSELQRLSLLVDKVLKLSLFENKGIELKLENFDLKDLAEDVIKTMQLQVQKQKAELSFLVDGSNFMINADKLHVTSVIYNLVDNALKYSPDNPKINISLTEKRNSIELKVQDNGIGIPSEYKEKIFDKFFRVPHGNTHNIKGYGLGLSYVHHVIEKHKGSIEVESVDGNGSTFTVNLLRQT
jgi:two-component system phosphate regulon sensor histidine kinase PhoR